MRIETETPAERRLRDLAGWLPGNAAAIDMGREALKVIRTMREQKADMHVVWIYQIDALLARAGEEK